jgi:hypothetical protein
MRIEFWDYSIILIDVLATCIYGAKLVFYVWDFVLNILNLTY